MTNKRPLMIFSVTLVFLMTIYGLFATVLGPSTFQTVPYKDPLVPGPAPLPIQGSKATLEEFRSALSISSFKIPSYRPADLVSIRLQSQSSLATLIFSTAEVKEQVTIDEVVSRGGMILIVHVDPKFKNRTIIENIIDRSIKDTKGIVQRITVNGAIGMGIGEGVYNNVHAHGQIQWWRDGVHYDLIADLPLEELIRIAESM